MNTNCKQRLGMVAGLFFLVWLVISSPVSGFAAEGNTYLLQRLKAGHSFILMRHAIAPGTGDPDNFALNDCSTQRNLSDAGRQQALAIGDTLRANGIVEANVFSSQWCRCLETAELLKLGEVRELPPLNSFFRQYARRDQQIENLQEWLDTRDFDIPHVLVTHQVNITALTGYYPALGEMVIVHRSAAGDIEVLGSIITE
ncbi:MAG: histidine phosphatase family protein [Desulfopila sp.]